MNNLELQLKVNKALNKKKMIFLKIKFMRSMENNTQKENSQR